MTARPSPNLSFLLGVPERRVAENCSSQSSGAEVARSWSEKSRAALASKERLCRAEVSRSRSEGSESIRARSEEQKLERRSGVRPRERNLR